MLGVMRQNKDTVEESQRLIIMNDEMESSVLMHTVKKKVRKKKHSGSWEAPSTTGLLRD